MPGWYLELKQYDIIADRLKCSVLEAMNLHPVLMNHVWAAIHAEGEAAANQ